MARQQRLVGGHHRPADAERGLDRALGRIALPAHQLHEHVDAGIARERDRIGRPCAPWTDRASRSLGGSLARIGDQLDRAAGALGQRVARERMIMAATAEPTVPNPARPTLSGSAMEDDPGRSVQRSAALGERHDVVQLFRRGFKKAPDVAGGLADALLVLDQRDAHEALAVLAEADAGRDRDLGLLDQQRRELDAAERSERLGIGAQANIEARGGGIAQPARPNDSDQHVAPALVGRRASRGCSRPGR